MLSFNKGDTKADAEWMAQKALRARVWNDPKTGKTWTSNALQNKFEALIVHQQLFLPDVPSAEQPLEDVKEEEALYAAFVAKARKTHAPDKVQAAAYSMPAIVSFVGDGPVTLILRSGTKEAEVAEDK